MYGVTIPIAGYIYKEVVADSEDEAIEMVMSSDDIDAKDIEEWDMYRHMSRGNVRSYGVNDAVVQDLGEADGDEPA